VLTDTSNKNQLMAHMIEREKKISKINKKHQQMLKIWEKQMQEVRK